MKGRGSTPGLHWKLPVLSAGEVSGIPSVAVKCVDIRRNTSGEGGAAANALSIPPGEYVRKNETQRN